MKKCILFAFWGLILIIIAGCASPYSQVTAPLNQNQASNQTTVVIQNFAFNPPVLTVTKGTTVTWTNNDSVTHQIKSDTFNSDRLDSGASFSFTFNTPGSYDYVCAIHSNMKGKIIVN